MVVFLKFQQLRSQAFQHCEVEPSDFPGALFTLTFWAVKLSNYARELKSVEVFKDMVNPWHTCPRRKSLHMMTQYVFTSQFSSYIHGLNPGRMALCIAHTGGRKYQDMLSGCLKLNNMMSVLPRKHFFNVGCFFTILHSRDVEHVTCSVFLINVGLE